MDGEIARTFLESYGLHAVLFDADSQGYVEGLSPDVRLMVFQEDAAEALAVLDSV